MEEYVSNNIDKFNGVASLLAKCLLGVGVLVVLIYCMRIGFFPVGLTLSDSLVFIFLAIGFGVLYLFWISLGFFIIYGGHLAHEEYKKVKERKAIELEGRALTADEEVELKYDYSVWLMPIASLFFVAILVLLAIFFEDVFVIIIPLASGFMLFLVTIKWTPLDPSSDPVHIQQRENVRWFILAMALAVAPLMAMSFINALIDVNMKKLGFRQESVSLVLSDENYKTLTTAARTLGLQVLGCPGDSGDNNIVHNVNVLWNGFGERTLIEIVGPKTSGEPAARLELDRQGVSVLKVLDVKTRRSVSYKACLNLEAGSLFESNGAEPTALGKRKINEFRRQLRAFAKTSGLSVVEASITGYADRQPLKAKGDTNLELSRRRALSVSQYLGSILVPLSEDNKSIVGRGVAQTRAECPAGLAPADMSSCLSSDRRVEVVVEFGLRP